MVLEVVRQIGAGARPHAPLTVDHPVLEAVQEIAPLSEPLSLWSAFDPGALHSAWLLTDRSCQSCFDVIVQKRAEGWFLEILRYNVAEGDVEIVQQDGTPLPDWMVEISQGVYDVRPPSGIDRLPVKIFFIRQNSVEMQETVIELRAGTYSLDMAAPGASLFSDEMSALRPRQTAPMPPDRSMQKALESIL